MIEITIKKLTVAGKPCTVHAISTGYVAVKRTFREARSQGTLAVLRSFLDPKFTEWMAIFVWVIEHPDGTFVIDTGENARVNEPGYFRRAGVFSNWLNTTQFRFQVTREEEIDRQLETLRIDPVQVDGVILTHLHLDHVDGLHHFPGAPVYVNRLEWEKPYGDLPFLYPAGFSPELVDLNENFSVFPKTASLTADGSLRLVETPGHTYGHTSVLLQTDEGDIFFAGDVSYLQQQLLDDRYAAANVLPAQARETYRQIKAYARERQLVYLPSHEIDGLRRLEQMESL